MMTLVAFVLLLPKSSSNLANISPATSGTMASVELPATAGIRSTEFGHVAVPSVGLLCLM